jgi:hypothetical protein
MTVSKARAPVTEPPSDPAALRVRRPVRVSEAPPTLEEAAMRLEAARGRPRPWLTPAGLAAMDGAPDVIGPEVYRKP